MLYEHTQSHLIALHACEWFAQLFKQLFLGVCVCVGSKVFVGI